MLENLFSTVLGFKSYLIAAAFVAVLVCAGTQTVRQTLAKTKNKVLTAEKQGLKALILLLDCEHLAGRKYAIVSKPVR